MLSLRILLLIALTSLSQLGHSQSDYLDISISIFDMNLPEDKLLQKQMNIYSEVREAESRYIPALLRATLQESDRWGAIRITPAVVESAELMISGVIVKSDGLMLELAILAVDSSGQEWINKNYSSTAMDSISLNNPEQNLDPFQSLYNQILTDLITAQDSLSVTDKTQIKNLSFLRYGASLSPDFFTPYIQRSPDGKLQYSNFPASNDPMLERVEAIRQNEYLFIDVVDEQYQSFLLNIKPVYDLWRDYTQELVQNSTDYQARQSTGNDFRRGSYRALRESYDNFRWEKMQAQYLDQLSEGFSNEVLPTKVETEDSVYELSGTLENQYWEWREILQALFDLEN